jgi:hypothetical protein
MQLLRVLRSVITGYLVVTAARAELRATRQSLTGELLAAFGRFHTAETLDQLTRRCGADAIDWP